MKIPYFVIIALCVSIYIVNTVRKNKFSIEESFFWFIGSLVALILAVFPKIFDGMAKLFGIDYPPSLFFLLCILFLLLINFRNSRRLAVLQEKIVELAQQVALLKNKEKGGKK